MARVELRSRLPLDRVREFERLGLRPHASIGDLLRRSRTTHRGRLALEGDGVAWTWDDLDARVEAAVAWMLANGVASRDIVAWQAPNIPVAVALFHACWEIGAIAAPLVGILREADVRSILAEIQPKAVATVAENRGFPHAEMFDDLLAEARLERAPRLLLRGSRPGWTPWSDLAPAQGRTRAAVHPDEPALILQTSGSTGASKSVVHSSRALVAEALHTTVAWDWQADDLSYVATSTAHMSGLLRGVVVPGSIGSPTLLRTHWESDRAVCDLVDRQAAFFSIPSALLTEFTDAYQDAGAPPHSVKVSCAIASLGPDAFAEADRQGFHPINNYGLSEAPTLTDPRPGEDFALRVASVGPPTPGCEFRIVSADPDAAATVDLPVGAEGELVVRAPEQMLGYLDPVVDSQAWLDYGWLRTGDLGRLDATGRLVLTGRLKDVINRGGEKLSASQIETALRAHPDVVDVAVVPAPDPRLGEVPFAFVVPSGPAQPDAYRQFLQQSGLPDQKIPVGWRFVEQLPRTATGKISKGQLRETLDDWRATDDADR